MAITKPRAGDLNRHVTLRRRSDSPSDDGGLASQFSEEKKRWARIEPVGTAIYHNSVQTDAKITHRITLRYLGVLPIDFEVVHGADVYRVRRATDMNGSHKFTVLEVEELGTDQPGGSLYG